MSNETKQALDLFCEVYDINSEQREKIKSLMRIAYLEGGMAVREEWINNIGNYGNTIRHHSGAAQN